MKQVVAALAARGFEVVEHKESDKQLRLMGRIPRNINVESSWMLVIYNLLARQGATWTIDISRQYVLLEGRVRYVWRLIIQSSDLAGSYNEIAKHVTNAPRPNRVELEEFPLSAKADRNSKGNVGPVGKVPLGPRATAFKR